MPIGTIRPSRSVPAGQYLSDSGAAQLDGGVGTALQGLANKLNLEYTRVTEAAKAEAERAEDFDARLKWNGLQGQMARSQVDRIANAPASGAGLTDTTYNDLSQMRDQFIDTLPPRLQAEYRGLTEGVLQDYVTKSYTESYKLRFTYETEELSKTTGVLAESVYLGETTREEALAELSDLVERSALPETARTALLESATADLGMVDFQRVVEEAMKSATEVRPADGSDVVAPGLLPTERGLLNAIAARESAGSYNVLYGGEQFTDYSWHPNKVVEKNGTKSTAAGRYQFLYSTWVDVANKLGLTDFSPASQDRAALFLAQQDYNRKRAPGARDFTAIMREGSDEEILNVKRILGGEGANTTWQAFQSMSDAEFLSLFKGEKGLAGGGTGGAAFPNVWTDERFADLDFDTKMRMAGKAQEAVSQLQTQIKAQQTEFAEQLKANLAAGTAGEEEVMSAINSRSVPTSSYDELLKLVADEREARLASEEFSKNVASGTPVLNDKDTQKAAFTYLQKSGIYAGLEQATPEAASKASSLFAASGVMPPEVSGLIGALARSNNPMQVAYAMDLLASMRAKNEIAFAGALPKDLVELEGVWSMARKYSPQGDTGAALDMLRNFRDPAQAALRETMREEARKQLTEITNEQIADAFDVSWFGADPEFPASPANQAMLRKDFSALYETYYPMFGDQAKTTEFVAEQMRYKWGIDEVGGRDRLMYLAPTSAVSGYRPIEGSYSWLRSDLLQSMGWDEDQEFELISDGQTEADIRGGKPASYVLMYRDDSGMWRTHGDGDLSRVRFTMSPTLVEEERRKIMIRNLETALERAKSLTKYSNKPPTPEMEATEQQLNELLERQRLAEREKNLQRDPNFYGAENDPGMMVAP